MREIKHSRKLLQESEQVEFKKKCIIATQRKDAHGGTEGNPSFTCSCIAMKKTNYYFASNKKKI